MAEQNNTAELTVIGGGPGGYAAAFLAADMGMAVTLIDPRTNPGGVCLFEGCIPSKTLLNAVRLMHAAAAAEKWGLAFAKPEIDLAKLRQWKNDVVDKLTGGLGRLTQQRNITHIRGTAVFTGDDRLSIRTRDGAEQTLGFTNAIIATGSRAASVPGLDFDGDRIVDAGGALALKDVPGKLLVVGGGYIGLELGTVYAGLGAEVTVVEMTPGLLPGADRDLVNVLKKRLGGQFAAMEFETRVSNARVQKNGVMATLEGTDGASRKSLFDRVLVAVGRRPNTADIGLDQTGVELDDRGFVRVDEQCRTSVPHIYAIGDAAGEPMLAHKAAHQGRTAVEVVAGRPVAFEPAAIPGVVFTEPEIAWAGLTETRARQQKIKVAVSRFPWAASGRAATLDQSDGLTKLVVAPETERILGVGIVGPGAGEMIAEGVVAIEMGANLTDLRLSIHPHPTLSETLMEAADLYFGTATHFYRPKRKK